MVSIKVDVNDIENIVSCLDIIILKYIDKNGSLENAVVFVPSVVYKLMSKKINKGDLKEGVGVKSLWGWVKIVEDTNGKDTLIIIDKTFFNFSMECGDK